MAETIYNSFGDLSGEDNAQKWRNFFNQNISMFLRNAVIYKDMVAFYSNLGVISKNPIAIFIKSPVITNVRLTPISDANVNNLIYATNSIQDMMPNSIEVYGIVQIQGLYWLYVKDVNRLVWTISTVAQIEQGTPITSSTLDTLINENQPQQPIDINQVIGLSQSFNNSHLNIITGESN